MLFESTTLLLQNIVHSLENTGDNGWDDHLELGNQCLYELHQMSRTTSRTYKADSNARFQVVTPPFERAIRAIPHVKAMMRSMRRKDQAAAVESGRAAIAEMDGIRTALPSVPSIDSKADQTPPANSPKQPARTVHQYKKPATKKRAAVSKRQLVRASAVGSR